MLLSVPFFYFGSQNIIFMLTYLLTNGLCTHKLLLSMLSYECRQFHLSFTCNGSYGRQSKHNGRGSAEKKSLSKKQVVNAFLHSSYQQT